METPSVRVPHILLGILQSKKIKGAGISRPL